jgi:Tol biopolymer transport system component
MPITPRLKREKSRRATVGQPQSTIGNPQSTIGNWKSPGGRDKPSAMRNSLPLLILSLFALLAGCAHEPRENPTPPQSESEILWDAVQLTHNFQAAGEAYFSPDMKWIVFQATTKPDEDYQMYLAQLKWQDDRITGLHTPIRISPEGSWNSCGYFSPDGNSIIFASTGDKKRETEPPPPSARSELVRPATTRATAPAQQGRPPSAGYRWKMPRESDIFRADGWKAALAALPPGGSTNLAKHSLTPDDAHQAECAFSPDGQWIVYMSKSAGGDPELYVMRADGSRQTRLTFTPGYDGGPFFSPDGQRLVYRSDRKGNELLQVFVADLVRDSAGNITALKNERPLTDNDAVNFGPWWHPDHHHLIWANSLQGQRNFELYLMRDDGTRQTRITFTEGGDVLPVFSPDGKWLMWTSRRGQDKTSQIWVARFKMPKGT